MVSLLRCRARSLIATLRHRPFFANTTRRIINGALDDILLHQWDLPPDDPDYLTVLQEKRFLEKYGIGKFHKIYLPEMNRTRRLAVVLPLKIADGKVIPIPYIVDTGAPGLIYLGSKPLDILSKMGLVKQVQYSEFQYLLSGVLTYGNNEITQVFASDIPGIHEAIDVRGDVRCNLLGLDAALNLGVLKTGESDDKEN